MVTIPWSHRLSLTSTLENFKCRLDGRHASLRLRVWGADSEVLGVARNACRLDGLTLTAERICSENEGDHLAIAALCVETS
jgi:hypothetical protein